MKTEFKSFFLVFLKFELILRSLKKSGQFVKTLFIAVLILLGSRSNIASQDFSYEIWPEIDVWYKITPGLRLSSFATTTRYLESNTRDFNITLQADHSFGKSKKFLFTRLLDQNQAEALKVWLIRGGYMGGWSLYDLGESYSEDMLFAEIHRRFFFRRAVFFFPPF